MPGGGGGGGNVNENNEMGSEWFSGDVDECKGKVEVEVMVEWQ